MANTKISALPANNNPTGSEELVYALNNSNGKMTLSTMKTFANTGQQAELVSGTNIKTINNQSLLGAGNIDIQGGGGGSGADYYDAIVDAGGNGDYTTIGAALDDNKRKIFVKNGTYNETLGHFVTLSGVDKVIIHGESRVGVVVTATLTSVVTQWSEYKNYPALFFLDARNSNDVELNIKNITFDLSVNSNETTASVVRVFWKNDSLTNTVIDNCTFDVSNDGSNRMYFEAIGNKSNSHPRGMLDICNCTYIMMSNTANMLLDADAGNLPAEMGTYKNCYFKADANNSNKGGMTIKNAYDCIVRYESDNMGGIDFVGKNMENCDIYPGANIAAATKIYASLEDVRNCIFECRHEGGFTPTKIGVSSAIQDWAASTAYSLGDQVIYGGTFYQCNTAHTSSSDWYDDNEDEYWDAVATIFITDATGCTIRTGDTVEIHGKFVGNHIDMSYDNGDILLPSSCIFEGNSMADDYTSRNMYVNNHTIINGNRFGGFTYSADITIKYVSTNINIITNNLLTTTTNISKIGTGSATIVDNNGSWS